MIKKKKRINTLCQPQNLLFLNEIKRGKIILWRPNRSSQIIFILAVMENIF